MLLVCIRDYLKSVPRYIFLILDIYHPEIPCLLEQGCILDIYHPDILCLLEQGCEDSWLFVEANRDPGAETFGKHFALNRN